MHFLDVISIIGWVAAVLQICQFSIGLLRFSQFRPKFSSQGDLESQAQGVASRQSVSDDGLETRILQIGRHDLGASAVNIDGLPRPRMHMVSCAQSQLTPITLAVPVTQDRVISETELVSLLRSVRLTIQINNRAVQIITQDASSQTMPQQPPHDKIYSQDIGLQIQAMNSTNGYCPWAEDFCSNLVAYWSLQFISAVICAQVHTVMASAIVESLIPPLTAMNVSTSECTYGGICEVKCENLGRRICNKCGKEWTIVTPREVQDPYDLD